MINYDQNQGDIKSCLITVLKSLKKIAEIQTIILIIHIKRIATIQWPDSRWYLKHQ